MPGRPAEVLRFATAILAAVTARPTPLPAQETDAGSILGTVTSALTGQALEGADVILLDLSVRASSEVSGRFRLLGVPAGVHTLVVRYVGLIPDTLSVAVGAGEITRVAVELSRPAAVLPELVVTAQKRTQTVVDVPITITTYDAGFLQNNEVREFDALSSLVPGAVIELQSPNNPSFSIRGITSEGQDSRLEPRVSVFQDGVSISKATGSVVELFDLERVEVLKGPQGTLFGRAAEIGAVHLIQNKAANETSAALQAGYGSYTGAVVQGYLNAPLVQDRLFGRIAGIWSRHDGFVENISGGTLNGKETIAARGALRWLPSERTVVDLIGNFQLDQPPGVSFKSGVYRPLGGNRNPSTFADLEEGTALGIDRTVWDATLLVDNASSSRWELTSITAFRRFDSDEAFDADGTVAPALAFHDIGNGSQFSQELRAAFADGHRFAGFGGVSFFWENGSQSTPVSFNEQAYWPAFTGGLHFLTSGTFPITPITINGQPNLIARMPPEVVLLNPALAPLVGQPFATSHSEAQTNFGRTWALETFADGTLRLANRLRLTAGLRATYNNVNNGLEVTNSTTTGLVGYLINTVPNDLFAPTNGRENGTGEFTNLVGRAIASYLITDRFNVYAGVARGVRPAVVNVLADTVQVVPHEIVWSYEAGLKLITLGDRLQLDAAGFHYDYTNFQVDRPDTSTGRLILLSTNAGPMAAWGAEVSARAAVIRQLSLFATYAYLNAAFDSTNSGGSATSLFPGKHPRLAPENAFSIGANLTVPAGGFGTISVQPNYAWRSQMFFDENNTPFLSQPAYGLLNARVGWTSPNSRWEVILWGRNLLDQAYVIDAGNTGQLFATPTFVAGWPRQIGVQIGWRR